MNKKVRVGQKGGIVTITDKNYKAAGGEASIYVNGGKVFKIYHDAKKVLPAKKIQELATITNPQVVIPQEIIYDASSGDAIGYTTGYINDAEPLLKLFTKTFKQDNNIDPAMIVSLVKQMQVITTDIHVAHCLISDYNELNELVKLTPQTLTPFFIDVDSYQTPSYKSTAIMDSIRDRRVSKEVNGKMHYNPDVMSDWFSWGVLTFWLYTNIHPFRGSHPNYRPKDKLKQMDDGISVFHKDVKCPPCVNSFNVIPQRHLDWFKDTFLNNNRSVPPLPDGIAPIVVPAAIITIKGTDRIDVIPLPESYVGNIASVFEFLGIKYVITHKIVYGGKNELMRDCDKVKKTLVAPASDGTMTAATLSGTKVSFYELNTNRLIDTLSSTDLFQRNNCYYTVTNGRLVENSFTTMGTKIIHRINEVENISNYSATIYDGCIIQDLLGKFFLTMPYKKGACFTKAMPFLDGYRVIDAKSERTVTVIIAEKGGQFDRFILIFKSDFSDFDVRKVEDIAYDTINFTTMDNGVTVLLASPTELELFASHSKIDMLADPPFDANMKLFNTSDGIFFINGNTISQIKKK